MTNRFPGTCHACGTHVPAAAGHYITGKHTVYHPHRRRAYGAVWCSKCFDAADNSSAEDRCCGNAAYEDACARACGR